MDGRHLRSISIAIGAAFLSMAPPAAASGPCAERERTLAYLADTFGEAPVVTATTESGATIEIVASRDGATWTLLVTVPGGLTCMVSSGQNLKTVPFDLPVPGRPS